MVLRGWPQMVAWTKTNRQKHWVRVRPDIDLQSSCVRLVAAKHHSGRLHMERQPLQDPQWRYVPELFTNVPLELVKIVERLPLRQWHVLSASSRCKGFDTFLISNPGLAFALASSWCFSGLPSKRAMTAIRSKLKVPRHLICGFLGFPSSRSMVAILSRVRHESLSVRTLLMLRTMSHRADAMKMLRHLAVINRLAVEALVLLGSRCTFNLLRDFSETKNSIPCLAAMFLVRKNLKDSCPIKSLDHLMKLAQKIRDLDRHKEEQKWAALQFPPPPFLTPHHIIPIQSARSLVAEGIEMNHCIADYAACIAEGTAYAFKVTAPQRATLLVEHGQQGWQLKELRARFNAEVASEAQLEVSCSIRDAIDKTPF